MQTEDKDEKGCNGDERPSLLRRTQSIGSNGSHFSSNEEEASARETGSIQGVDAKLSYRIEVRQDLVDNGGSFCWR